jgi:hypothetical protein
VIARFIGTGTHQEAFIGIAATGNEIEAFLDGVIAMHC